MKCSQSGNAVIFALGCAAVIGAVSIETSRYMKQNEKRNNNIALREEGEAIMEAFQTRLRNPDDCTDLLAGEVLEPGRKVQVTIPNFLEAESESPFPFPSVQLDTDADEDFRTEILDENGVLVELRRYPVRLHVVWQDPAGNVDLQVAFFAWATPPPPLGTGQIQSCFGSESAGTLCNELGGYFVPRTTPYSQSCRQSLKTLKRNDGTLTPLASCRIGHVAAKAGACPDYGVQFGAAQINGRSSIIPKPGNVYLCQVCQ